MKPTPRSLPTSIDATLDLLAAADYLADRSLATVLFLALKMGRPLFLEGEAGVGKTEIAKVPGVGKRLSEQVVGFVQGLRKQDLFKAPGVAETLDWAGALSELDVTALDPATVSDTLGVLLKYQDDIAPLEGSKVKDLLDQVKSELRAAE